MALPCIRAGVGASVVTDDKAPLNAILRVSDPTSAQRILQHARRLEVALEQGNVDQAYREFSLMIRLYKESGHAVHDPQ